MLLYIRLGYQSLNSTRNVWLRRPVHCQYGQVTFPNKQQFSNNVVASMVNKTMECHVFLTFVDAIIVITTFDLWMFQGGFDMFILVVNYINKKWEPCHVIMGVFEVHETSRATMDVHFKDLLVQYNLLDKIIAYVKDKGANMNTFIVALINIVSCVFFWLPQPYATSCYGHAMSKCC